MEPAEPPRYPLQQHLLAVPWKGSCFGPVVALWPPGYFFCAQCVVQQEGCNRFGYRYGQEQCSSFGQTPNPDLMSVSCCRNHLGHPRFYKCPQSPESERRYKIFILIKYVYQHQVLVLI